MLSDGAIVGLPPRRLFCRRCGSATLAPVVAQRLSRRLYGTAYALNAGPPTVADIDRQAGYARLIADLLGADRPPPAAILDVGCGNGGLLLALSRLWPDARLCGVEPAPGAAAAARAAGLPVSATLPPGRRAALVVSVNVIEHTPDPLAFLRRLRTACAPGGRIVLICPDGTGPWLELLMADHRHSLSRTGLQALARRAGLAIVAAGGTADGCFQALVLRAGPTGRGQTHGHVSPAAQRRYLGAWQGLDAALGARRDPLRRLICFGCGEAARLLRAYAPATWRAVAAVTADDPAGSEALGKPFLPVAGLEPATDQVLLAVRPQAQAGLARRLSALGLPVLRWDGVITR